MIFQCTQHYGCSERDKTACYLPPTGYIIAKIIIVILDLTLFSIINKMYRTYKLIISSFIYTVNVFYFLLGSSFSTTSTVDGVFT